MKIKKYITIFIILLTGYSCNIIIDKDTTDEISSVSIKPVVELIGSPIMSLPVGSTYTEEGLNALVGDSIVDYQIISGNVNPNAEGFYVVTYKAENQFGWATYAYRSVLVYSGSPYNTDIAGNYIKGFNFSEDISKYSVDGYWQITNVLQEEGAVLPIIFADRGNNLYGIVPGNHPTKGKYSGSAVKSSNKITFYIHFTSPEGIETDVTLEWTKQ